MKAILLLITVLFTLGCDVPYHDEITQAMELKLAAEKKLAEAQELAAKAKLAEEKAKADLATEQKAMIRIYNED